MHHILLNHLAQEKIPTEAPLKGLPFLHVHPFSKQSPQVEMLAWQTQAKIYFFWIIQEEAVRAKVHSHNGPVWTDSCIELFFKTKQSDLLYYNIEISASGALLIQSGKDRHNRSHLDPKMACAKTIITADQANWSCLLQLSKQDWEPPLIGNSYKCADHSLKPHWLSLFSVPTERPDFHRPEFFKPFSYL